MISTGYKTDSRNLRNVKSASHSARHGRNDEMFLMSDRRKYESRINYI